MHVHTKLSEMDGVCDIEEFIETADRWGMDAIAISDHMVAQAFPKAQAAVSAIIHTFLERTCFLYMLIGNSGQLRCKRT